eukprot:10777896-Lingulodinium_polyedra.AAC.1
MNARAVLLLLTRCLDAAEMPVQCSNDAQAFWSSFGAASAASVLPLHAARLNAARTLRHNFGNALLTTLVACAAKLQFENIHSAICFPPPRHKT